ncbi:MAG: replicative DNA helicase [Phycisphaerae bacterium]
MPSPDNRDQPSQQPQPRSRSSGSAYDRELPHAVEAERALLGCMLLDSAAIGEAITVMQDAGAAVYFFEKHQILHDHIIRMWNENRSIDGVLIKDGLVRVGAFEQLGGFDFLTSLASSVPSSLRVREYAEIVRDKYLLRQLIRSTHEVLDLAFEDREPTAQILDQAEKTIFDVTERRVSGGAQGLPELIDEVFAHIQDLDGTVLTGCPTGFVQLDEMTCGLQPGELIIVAGRPSMGKTAFGLNMCEHLALSEGKPALFFSLEMSRQQVAQRLLCSRARVDAQKLRRGRHSGRDLERLKSVADEIRSKPLFIDDTSTLSILELRARARMAWRRHRIGAIYVDYLQLMHAPGNESRQQEVAEISRGLKALAKDLRLPVVAMAQLNRNSEERSQNKPRMSDLRESGAIEQDADVIMLLHRESYYKVGEDPGASDDTKAELIIAKQRNGPVGSVDLVFNRQYTRFDTPGATHYEGTYEAQHPKDTEYP